MMARFSIITGVVFLLAGCNSTTGPTPSDIGTYISDGDLAETAQYVWRLARPHLEVAAEGAEGIAGDTTGLVDTVTDLADDTLGQSIRGSRIGIESGYREGALAGALAGSVAGLASGPWLVREHTSYLVTRETLEEEIAYQHEAAEALGRDINTGERALALHRRGIADLQEAYADGLVEVIAWERALATIEADRRILEAMISGATQSVAVLVERIASFRRAGLDVAPLDRVEEARKRDIANLRAIEDALVALMAGIPREVRTSS